jgi:tetratricopeptide (TPR) repeat protein
MMRKIVFLFLMIFLFSCTDNKDLSLKKVDEGIDMLYRHKMEKAKKLFEEAVELNDENYEAWYYLGNYYANKRNYKKAIENYTKAISVNGKFADAYFGRAEAKFYMNDKKGACADWKLASEYGRKNLKDKLRHCN